MSTTTQSNANSVSIPTMLFLDAFCRSELTVEDIELLDRIITTAFASLPYSEFEVLITRLRVSRVLVESSSYNTRLSARDRRKLKLEDTILNLAKPATKSRSS
jgi:hypothetical protein